MSTVPGTFAEAMSHALNGDMGTALPLFQTIDAQALDAKDQSALARVLADFDTERPRESDPGLDVWTARVLDAYRDYWTRTLMGVETAEGGTQNLAATLARLIGITGEAAAQADMDAIEPALKERLRSKGFFSLHGVTSPFREFMLWRTQQVQDFQVELPESNVAVSVVMLDGFICLGWAGYATGNRYHCAGWATREHLYCVRSSYDPGSEAFRVSYLAHEAQHFTDYKRFPQLEGPELEYRAKLVELVYADTTRDALLGNFGRNGSDSRDNPHGFANRRLTNDLVRLLKVAAPAGPWWDGLPPASIRAAARELFDTDTRRLACDHERQEQTRPGQGG